MHPAKSVIFFTTASGAGYGLLIWLAVFSAAGVLAPDRAFGLIAFALALGLVTAGLLSSTLHLGHPERAWRALSQWRSSWLSREGVAAVVTYPPALLFAALWALFAINGASGGVAGVVATLLGGLTAVLALATIYCTSMIYASLQTVRAWSNVWTPIGYLVYGLMTGAALLAWLGAVWSLPGQSELLGAAMVTVALGYMVKREYWGFLDGTQSASTIGTATGLGEQGEVRLLEAPHTETNYLLTEMGFEIARSHATRLRQYTRLLAFAVPFACFLVAFLAGGWWSVLFCTLGTASMTVGIGLERWLFFAEAQHVVTLYYGRQTA
ncbi:MAG: DmsC/YnfH family molybdoenzyme membrane anchor subunit [Pseudomonadota bacterium]